MMLNPAAVAAAAAAARHPVSYLRLYHLTHCVIIEENCQWMIVQNFDNFLIQKIISNSMVAVCIGRLLLVNTHLYTIIELSDTNYTALGKTYLFFIWLIKSNWWRGFRLEFMMFCIYDPAHDWVVLSISCIQY